MNCTHPHPHTHTHTLTHTHTYTTHTQLYFYSSGSALSNLTLPSLSTRALYLMTKRNFKPPTLQHKNKWSENFHDFLRFALQKDPKRRPTAIELLKVRTWGGMGSREVTSCHGATQGTYNSETTHCHGATEGTYMGGGGGWVHVRRPAAMELLKVHTWGGGGGMGSRETTNCHGATQGTYMGGYGFT